MHLKKFDCLFSLRKPDETDVQYITTTLKGNSKKEIEAVLHKIYPEFVVSIISVLKR